MKEYFKVLGLEEGASQKEIKRKYRELALEHHPDHSGDEEKFKEINDAYQHLSHKKNPYYQKHNVYPDFGFKWVFDQIQKRKQQYRPPEYDHDVRLGIDLSIDVIKTGKEFTLDYQQSEDCKSCKGVGAKEKIVCGPCQGKGFTLKDTKQGDITFWSASVCSDCTGMGCTLIDPCFECNSLGFKVVDKSITFEVKEKK